MDVTWVGNISLNNNNNNNNKNNNNSSIEDIEGTWLRCLNSLVKVITTRTQPGVLSSLGLLNLVSDKSGHNFSIFKDRCYKDIRKYAFKGRTTDQWNNLPNNVVNAPSLNSFKNRLDKLWMSKEIMQDRVLQDFWSYS